MKNWDSDKGLRDCAVVKCKYQVRRGLVRYGKAEDGSDLADGRFCWRCRRKQRTKTRTGKVEPWMKKGCHQ